MILSYISTIRRFSYISLLRTLLQIHMDYLYMAGFTIGNNQVHTEEEER